MLNMDYCRFTNTLGDLRDCYAHIDDDIDGEEAKARDRLIKLCKQIATDYADEEDLA